MHTPSHNTAKLPRACTLLRAIAAVTIVVPGGIGLICTLAIGRVAIPLCLIPCIVGFTYIACAKRIERGQRTAAYVSLVMASLHAGAFLTWAMLVAGETVSRLWILAHPPRRGWVPDGAPDGREWVLIATIIILALIYASALVATIFHLAAFLRVQSVAAAKPRSFPILCPRCHQELHANHVCP